MVRTRRFEKVSLPKIVWVSLPARRGQNIKSKAQKANKHSPFAWASRARAPGEMVLLLLLAAVPLAASSAMAKPYPMILHSAYTPFGADGALDVSGVPKLAARAKALGVNTIWICGSMAEFDTLTIAEREALADAWISASKALRGLYTIVNVGTTVLAEARALAAHAKASGADAIASVPPYYNRPKDVGSLVDWLATVASGAPELPFWYYHIPGTTGVEFGMAELLPAAAASGKLDQLVKFGGVKFVSNDMADFLAVNDWVAAQQQQHNNTTTTTATILFAPEPKLQAFALQEPFAGAVLAEDFYAPTFLRMRQAYEAGDAAAALREQNWKLHGAEPVFAKYGGTPAKRATYRKTCGVDMGCNRSPGKCFNESNYAALVAELQQVGFWDQAPPAAASEPY